MTGRTASCPNCGAPIAYTWSSSVQTVCAHCRSIVVRTDVDLKRVGLVADLPPDASPIQLGTEGRYRDKAFVVAGRIAYRYDQGAWNEWRIVLDGGVDGWLSDAQNDFAVSFRVDAERLPAMSDTMLGHRLTRQGKTFTVTSRTVAHYAGVDGELPFEYWDATDVMFVDLRSEGMDFATLDYSDDLPVLYVGEFVDFDALQLRNVRRFEGW